MALVNGIHHVTCIASNAQENYDFYTKIGFRFIKKTVNQDDPGTYHLYYSDQDLSPGSILTFFIYDAKIPKSNVSKIYLGMKNPKAYLEKLEKLGVRIEGNSFFDPDGLEFEVTEYKEDFRFIKFLYESIDVDRSKALFEKLGVSDLFELKEADFNVVGSGLVHHIAFNVDSLEDQKKVMSGLNANFSPVIDRFYFTSIYFNDVSLVLEVATGNNFNIDEEKLGSSLVLPPWLESSRSQIEIVLPWLDTHEN